jgi:hypothetical protein
MTPLTKAYTVLGLALALIVALSLAGCGWGTPSGPQYRVDHNSGDVSFINTPGAGSTVGTAPCGATTTTQQNGPNQPVAGAPNCSTTTITTPPLEPAP